MSYFNVALLQLQSRPNHDDNLVKGLEACEQAKNLGADLALFPEVWQLGYREDLMLSENAISLDNDFILQFCQKAKELEMAIAITFLGKGKAGATNSLVVIDETGKIVLDYSKIYTCYFSDTEKDLEQGAEFKVVKLKFRDEVVQLGAMICFDREFCESGRALMQQGAEVVLVPNACDLQNDAVLDDTRFCTIRARAFENKFAMAVTNYPQPFADGCSCGVNIDGKVLFVAGEDEGVFMTRFDLQKIRDWQKSEPWGEYTPSK